MPVQLKTAITPRQDGDVYIVIRDGKPANILVGGDGKSILNGTVNPTMDIGEVDEFYINTTTHYMFGPKTPVSWGVGIKIEGTDGVNPVVTVASTTSVALAAGPTTLGYDAVPAIGWTVGMRLRAFNDGNHYMEGSVSAVSTTSVTITVDRVIGSGTFASWSIGIAGDVSSAAWGAITGTLASQTDLQSALNAKAGLGVNTFTGNQTISNTWASLTITDNDATLGGAASARVLFFKGASLGGYFGYAGAASLALVAQDGDITIAADNDNNEANSVINLMVDGAVVGVVEPAATATQAATVMTRTKGDARYLTSPAIIGTPTAPTAAAGTSTTQLATTAFAKAAADAVAGKPFFMVVAASDETTALTAGVAKVTFRMPRAVILSSVRASVTTAPTGGTLLTVDVNEAGVSILSTKLTFDASEKTTVTATTPPVLSDTALADDAAMTIDIDAVGSTIAGAGLKVTLIGTYA